MFQQIIYFHKLKQKLKNPFFLRQHRNKIKGLLTSYMFNAGDIVKVVYFRKSYAYVFEGICLGIRKKSFIDPNTSFFLRNIVLGIAIEMIFSYFSKRLYFLKLQDYKRKFASVNRNKIFFLRKKKNQHSNVDFLYKKLLK